MVNNPFLNVTEIVKVRFSPNFIQQCYNITVSINDQDGIWSEINPGAHAFPAFMMQLIIITFLNRLLTFIAKPLKQPRIVAHIIAGTLLGPSVMGRLKTHSLFLDAIFSISGVMTLESLGNIGLIYFLFLLGLEIDYKKITWVGQKSIVVGLVGTIFPFMVGSLLYYLLIPNFGRAFQIGCLFWGVAYTDSSLSVTTQILAKLKLLYTDIGKTFMSTAVANEIVSWVFLTVLLAIGNDAKTAPLALISTIGFLVFCFFVIRPVSIWMINRNQEYGELNEQTICIILTIVLACGLVTDLLGTTSIIGAFAFGLFIPSGLLGPKFVEMVRGFVEELLMPIFFATVGFRTNFDSIGKNSSWAKVISIIVLAYLCKILSIIAISFFYRTRFKEGIALGVLMNAKGILSIIALTFGRDYMVLDDQAFAVLLITLLVMTMATEPIMSILYNPQNHFLPNSNRAIQKLIPGSKLRVLACVHETQTVSGIVNLLEASYPCARSPLVVLALYLVQLTSHASALALIHGSNNAQADQINEAFDSFEKEQSFTTVEQQTVVSDYATMHADICSIAEYKRASCIILPFHKRQTIHESLENMSHDYKDVNDNVLANAPCSVAIFVDRGFGRFHETDLECDIVVHQIAMIYFGGPDDREALSYARKMAAHPNSVLTVVRFVESKKHEGIDVELIQFESNRDLRESKKLEPGVEQMLIDESFIEAFKKETAYDGSIVYMEKEASNGECIIDVLRVLVDCYDLFVVGRGIGVFSPLKEGLEEGSECPELGSIGDVLVTSQFASKVSVLVVQQYREPNPTDEGT